MAGIPPCPLAEDHKCRIKVTTKPGPWTAVWTVGWTTDCGLDYGLWAGLRTGMDYGLEWTTDCGLDYGLWAGLRTVGWTTDWNGLRTVGWTTDCGLDYGLEWTTDWNGLWTGLGWSNQLFTDSNTHSSYKGLSSSSSRKAGVYNYFLTKITTLLMLISTL